MLLNKSVYIAIPNSNSSFFFYLKFSTVDICSKKSMTYLVSSQVCFVSAELLLLSPARTWVTLGSAWAAWERVEWLDACKYVACTLHQRHS